MTCPRCQIDFSPEHWGECPHCGDGESGFLKTSTIFISTREGGGIFHSMEEVPDALRSTLVKSTHGMNARTIVIADQGGREHMAERLWMINEPINDPINEPANVPGNELYNEPASAGVRVPAMVWFGLALAVFGGAAAWLVYSRIL